MGIDVSDALRVESFDEEFYIAERHKCECGGRLKYVRQYLLEDKGQYYDELKYACLACSRSYEFLFDNSSLFKKYGV